MISLSHRAGRAICCVSTSIAALGCDLELIEPRSSGFIKTTSPTKSEFDPERARTRPNPGMKVAWYCSASSALSNRNKNWENLTNEDCQQDLHCRESRPI